VRLDWEISSVDRKKWNDTLQRIEKKDCTTNIYLDKIEDQFKLIKIERAQELDEIDIHNLKYVLSGQSGSDADVPSIVNYAQNYFNQNVTHNGRFKEGTKKNYQKAINHLEKFCYKSKRISTKVTQAQFYLRARIC
jgi:hypothetical protein